MISLDALWTGLRALSPRLTSFSDRVASARVSRDPALTLAVLEALAPADESLRHAPRSLAEWIDAWFEWCGKDTPPRR